jgi:DeoR/GlpR family transcriptional regulator of sugar metabolism
MLREERLLLITQKLTRDRIVMSSQLSQEFHLTASTVRSDLAELERRGMAKRTHGGAILAGPLTAAKALDLEERKVDKRFEVQHPEKVAIGRAAAQLVRDGEIIMVDGGTTTYEVVRNLTERQHLTIITCAINDLWQSLISGGHMQIFFSGGYLRPESMSLVGEVAETVLRGFRAQKAILGIDGISVEHGFTTLNFMEASVKKRMIEASQDLIIVADSTKLGKVCLVPVAQVDRPCTVVTDWNAAPGQVNALRERGVQVILAGPGETDAGPPGEPA